MRVLVPMDGSEQSWTALEYAFEQFPGATLVCLRVIDPVGAGYGGEAAVAAGADWFDAQQDAAEGMFEDVRERAAASGSNVDIETETEVGRPARAIAEAAEEVDHVVIGSHGRHGLSRVLLGSVAETVVRRSPVPVTVVR